MRRQPDGAGRASAPPPLPTHRSGPVRTPSSPRIHLPRPSPQVPVNLHIGNIGLAQPITIPYTSTTPTNTGMNLDNRRLGKGSTLYLPVKVGGRPLTCHATWGVGFAAREEFRKGGGAKASGSLLTPGQTLPRAPFSRSRAASCRWATATRPRATASMMALPSRPQSPVRSRRLEAAGHGEILKWGRALKDLVIHSCLDSYTNVLSRCRQLQDHRHQAV